jgi:hypothetical protein
LLQTSDAVVNDTNTELEDQVSESGTDGHKGSAEVDARDAMNVSEEGTSEGSGGRRAGAATDKPFVCQWPNCGKSFGAKSWLTTHELIHSGEKPYACDYDDCDFKTKQKGNLTQHQIVVHSERSYQKRFKCDEQNCGKTVATKSQLKRHKRIHTVEKGKPSYAMHRLCPRVCD